MDRKTKECSWCGKEFVPNNPNQEFCSRGCAGAHNATKYITKYGTEVRECKVCRKEFTVKTNSSRICCSRSCAGKLNSQKGAEAIKERARKRREKLSPKIRQLRTLGMSWADIARKVDLSRNTVYRIAEEFGLKDNKNQMTPKLLPINPFLDIKGEYFMCRNLGCDYVVKIDKEKCHLIEEKCRIGPKLTDQAIVELLIGEKKIGRYFGFEVERKILLAPEGNIVFRHLDFFNIEHILRKKEIVKNLEEFEVKDEPLLPVVNLIQS